MAHHSDSKTNPPRRAVADAALSKAAYRPADIKVKRSKYVELEAVCADDDDCPSTQILVTAVDAAADRDFVAPDSPASPHPFGCRCPKCPLFSPKSDTPKPKPTTPKPKQSTPHLKPAAVSVAAPVHDFGEPIYVSCTNCLDMGCVVCRVPVTTPVTQAATAAVASTYFDAPVTLLPAVTQLCDPSKHQPSQYVCQIGLMRKRCWSCFGCRNLAAHARYESMHCNFN